MVVERKEWSGGFLSAASRMETQRGVKTPEREGLLGGLGRWTVMAYQEVRSEQ